MENNLKQILISVTETILEQVAFVFIDERGDTCKPTSSDWDALGAQASFSGVNSGCIHLWISKGLAFSIAANMLALDNIVDLRKAGDAVMEICNIITGNFITAAFQNSKISLGIPELLSVNTLTKDFSDDENSTWFKSEDEQILILIRES